MYLTWIVIVLLTRLLEVCGDPQIVYKSTNLVCLPDPKYAENATCKVKALSWNKAVLNMDCDLIKPLRNISVHGELFKKGYNNRYHPFLVSVVVNLCDIIDKRNFAIYGKIGWQLIKQFTNVNHSCPFTGHLMARNLFIDANSSLLPNFPLGFYLISLKIFDNYGNKNETVGLIKYYMQSTEMVNITKKRN